MRRKRGRNFSYSDQKTRRYRKRWVFLGILAVFLFYFSFTSLFFSFRVLGNDTMAPTLRAGDRIIFSSYNIYSYIPWLDLENKPLPFRRGNIVLVNTLGGQRPGFFMNFLDGMVRLFTFQNVNLVEDKEHLFVKRVIGLSGDEVSMINFMVRVRVRGSAFSLTEFEVTDFNYTPDIPQLPALWDSSLPFSGNMETVTLGNNEIFLLSDDRSNTNDSRTWGPVPVRSIRGKALFRYWPITRLGRP